jgi:titin
MVYFAPMSKFKTTSQKFALLAVAAIALAACGGSSENSSSESTAAGRVKNAALLTAPDAPTALTGTPGVGQVALSWTAPANNGGSPIMGYYIEKSTDGANTWSKAASSTSATSATASGLTDGAFHYFRVAAYNSVGRGAEVFIKGINPLTNVIVATTVTTVPALKLTVPGAPTALTGTSGVGEVALSWTAPADNGGSAIMGYYIEKSTDGATTWAKAASSSSATSATASGLTAGTSYHFRVAAYNSVGRGAEVLIKGVNPLASVVTQVPFASTVTTVPALKLTVPGAPTALTGTPGAGQVTLSWKAPATNGGSAILGYYIEKSTDGANTWSKAASTTSATSATASGLTAGAFHYFRVIAYNSVGRGGEATIKGINPS